MLQIDGIERIVVVELLRARTQTCVLVLVRVAVYSSLMRDDFRFDVSVKEN